MCLCVLALSTSFKAQEPISNTDPAVVGQWTSVQSWPDVPVHAALLSNGRVVFYPYTDAARLWNPATGGFTLAGKAGYNIFCSGLSALADGRLLVTGGHVANAVGFPYASIYDSTKDAWTRVANMNAGRWYPTNTTLPSGDVLVVSGGIDTVIGVDRLPQVWRAATGSWRDLTSAQLDLPLYPWMFVAPNGHVFNAGPNENAAYLDVAGMGAWTDVAASAFGFRGYGTAVMYDDGKVLIAGGGRPPTNSVETIDLNSSAPQWEPAEPMAYPRRQLNATLLPDGQVLVTGGTSGNVFDDPTSPVYAAEQWDAATGHWSTMASETVYRGYHSIAVLLPDGRVLSAGGDMQPNAEVFSPPYLFKGPRPVVTAAPAGATYGQNFFVSSSATNIEKITLVRLSSVTHSINMDQRINRLAFSATAGGFTVTAPASANLCPPGYYMLFLIDNQGVPSIARIMAIAHPTLPNAPKSLTAKAMTKSRIDLKWADMSANEDGFSVRRSLDGINFTPLATLAPGLVAYTDEGLAPATKYVYQVHAFNGAGTNPSNMASAMTHQAVPAGPTRLTARVVSKGRVDLTWIDGSTNESGFKIEGSMNGNAFMEITRVAANVTTFSIKGLGSNKAYSFRVRAYNAVGGSSYSNVSSVKSIP